MERSHHRIPQVCHKPVPSGKAADLGVPVHAVAAAGTLRDLKAHISGGLYALLVWPKSRKRDPEHQILKVCIVQDLTSMLRMIECKVKILPNAYM